MQKKVFAVKIGGDVLYKSVVMLFFESMKLPDIMLLVEKYCSMFSEILGSKSRLHFSSYHSDPSKLNT